MTTGLKELDFTRVVVDAFPEAAQQQVSFQLRTFSSSRLNGEDIVIPHLLLQSTVSLRHFTIDSAEVLDQLPSPLLANLTSLAVWATDLVSSPDVVTGFAEATHLLELTYKLSSMEQAVRIAEDLAALGDVVKRTP